MHHNQHYAVFTSCSLFFFSSLHPARSASSWQGRMFFIYFCVVSHKFVSPSLRNPFGFFPMVFDGNPTHFIPVICTRYSTEVFRIIMSYILQLLGKFFVSNSEMGHIQALKILHHLGGMTQEQFKSLVVKSIPVLVQRLSYS